MDYRTVPGPDIGALRDLHVTYAGGEATLDEVREWHRAHPTLLVGAYDDELVGYCLGIRDGTTVELRGIAVVESHRRNGVGTELLDRFEDRARDCGVERVTLGSAGGYVDEFYRANGYEPASVLVRLDPDEVPDDYDERGYPIVDERIEDGVHKCYVGVDGFDPDYPAEVGEAFGDSEAIHVMEKRL